MGDFTHEEFVRVWQAASSVQEVVDKLSISYQKAINISSYCRRKGVQLKQFRKTGTDWDALAKLAQEL